MTYGLISGLAVWDKFYNKDALYKAWYSIIFAVAGFISIAFALLLQMYMKKRKKTKKQVNRKKTLKKNTDNVKKNKELDYDIEQVKRRFSALDKKLENDSKEELNKESNSVKTREKAYFSPAKSSTISFHLKKDEDFEATKFRTKKFRREIQNKLNEDRTFDDELKSNFNKSLDKKFKDNKIVIGKEKKINRVTINKDYE